MRKLIALAALTCGLGLATGCGNNDSNNDGNNTTGNNTTVTVPDTYTFTDASGESTVAYSGQITRHVLIEDLKSYMGGMSEAIDGGTFAPTADGEVVAELDYYFRFDGAANGENPIRLSTTPATAQDTYNAISTDKNLIDKLAGNDSSTDHKDWSTAFAGWSDGSIDPRDGQITSPQDLVEAWFEVVEDNAIARVGGTDRTVNGEVLPVYVTETGLDLNQLTQKFLVGAIAFSQAADDYADDDVEGKGLLASNARPAEGGYTPLEHAWDEAFGYFGAARGAKLWTLDEISAAYKDADGDGKIDLLSEYCFGASGNAAKRDNGSQDGAKTTFAQDAIAGFLAGRALISSVDGELSAAQIEELKGHRDRWEQAWEKAYAATVIHYINDVLGDMDKFGADDYVFLDHAKHWGELKGFALSFQFNPRSPLTDAQFVEFHQLVGDAPVLADAEASVIDDYKMKLVQARDLLGQAYGFDAANVQAW